jgi:hypothetical protein
MSSSLTLLAVAAAGTKTGLQVLEGTSSPPPPPPGCTPQPTCAGEVKTMLTAPATAATSSDAGTPMSSVRAATLPALTAGMPLRLRLAVTTAARSKL